ncbi:MAG: CARDB domain-containing protein, partial [Candidatus Thermoplasmatota archaeon]|nr:CARDB domain-containing protein [Candidatus Thermoplasmatota archaeon]
VALFEPIIIRNSTGFHWSQSNYYDERVWLSISANRNVIEEDTLSESSPILMDISGDGKEDIIVGSGNMIYTFFGNNGTLDWFLEIGPLGEDVSTMAFYNGAGATKRIVVNSITTTGQSLRTTVVNLDGDHLKNISLPLGSPLPYPYAGIVPMPVIGDVTGDGELDIIVTYPSRPGSGKIIVYSYSLIEVVTISGILGTLEAPPSLGDVDSDGDLELFVHSRYATTSFWIRMMCYDIVENGGDLSASALWTRDGVINLNTRLFSSPLVCDLNEDDAPDGIFIGHGRIYCISSTGQRLWNLTIQDQSEGFQGVVGDLGTDDFSDIYIDGKMISQQVVDLSVKKPWSTSIYLSGLDPVDGRETTINCLLQNVGTSPARDVDVSFLDSLDGHEVLIGTILVPEIDTTVEVSTHWTPEGAGNHTITVVIDPNQTIIETDETNNEGSHFFTVGEAFGDLTVHDIKFLRGDGEEVSTKRLVEGDPSTIMVQVANIGEKTMDGARVGATVNGTTVPGGGAVPVGSVPIGEIVNVSISWVPPEVPDTTLGTEFLIEVAIDTSGLDDLDPSNNFGSNSTRVKSKEPIAGYEIRGTVYGPEDSAEEDVTVTATNMRTSESLDDDTNANGAYAIFFPQTDYLEGEEVQLYAQKGSMWAETLIKLYSEDGTSNTLMNLSDIPTLSLDLSIDGPDEMEVMPGIEYGIRIKASNNGNIPGNLSLGKEISGNSTMSSGDFVIMPDSMLLSPGEIEDVELRFTVPLGELPGREIVFTIMGEMSGNSSIVKEQLILTFTIGRSSKVYHEFRGEKNVTLDANDIFSVRFPVYLTNIGNVEISYNLSVDEDLEEYSEFVDQDGVLRPEDSVLAEVIITYIGTDDRLRGDITLLTSGKPSSVSWQVTIDLEFPNLEVDQLISRSDPNAILGAPVTLLGTVRNVGNLHVKDIYCAFYANDQLIGGTTIDELEAGQTAVIDDVMWTPEGTGDKVVRFEIDPGNDLTEEDEGDNSASTTFSYYPDLSIAQLNMEPHVVSYHDEVTVTVSVKNIGNADIERGFGLEIRSGSKEGDILASEEYDVDVDAGGNDVDEVGLIFYAPAETGTIEIYVSVSPLNEDEKATSNNVQTDQLEISAPVDEERSYTIVIVIVVIVVVLLLGGGLYLWRFGLPSSPPPEEAPSGADEDTSSGEEGETQDEQEIDEEGPVLEMSLEPPSPDQPSLEPPEEEVLVAEVVEVEPVDVTIEPMDGPEEDEEGLIPEV